MGTGAVSCKSAAAGFAVDPASTGSIHCDNCRAQFSIFKKKRFCTTCRRCFCSSCLGKESAASKSRSTPIHSPAGVPPSTTTTAMAIRNCRSCSLIISGQFDRNELMKLKISDLKLFLVAKEIATDNVKEKQHLVELVVCHFGPNHLRHEENRERHEQFVDELRRQLFVDGAPTTHPFEDNRTANRGSHDSGDDGIGNSEDDADQEQDAGSTDEATDAPREGRSNWIPSARQQDHAEGDSSRPDATVFSDQADPTGANPSGQPAPVEPRISLDDLHSEADIEQLTIRQLKRLLATNFVSYKGCCERHEIVDKVKHLYLDHGRQRELAERLFSEDDAGSNGTKPPDAPSAAGAVPASSNDAYMNTPDAHLCKICMEAIMDCVLLECGHMATCTACGKRLSECPICRQYVIRAVRVFRV